MLLRENPYDFVNKDPKRKRESKKPTDKKPEKSGDDNKASQVTPRR